MTSHSKTYIDDIPGSLYLVDEVPQEHEGVIHDGKTDIVLDPAPSLDANDPLNWSYRRKLVAVGCVYTYVWLVGMAGTAQGSLLTAITNDTGIPLSTLNAGSGYSFLMLGLGGLVMLPLAFTFGLRPIWLLATLAPTMMNVWVPFITTDGAWLGNKIIGGFLGAPIESLAEVAICQIFYSHERGFYLGVYSLVLFGSNYFSPAISGYIYQGIGWHNTQYYCAGLCAACFVILFFFMEETNFNRAAAMAAYPSSSGNVTPSTEKEKDGVAVDTVEVGGGRRLYGKEHSFVYKMGMFRERFADNKQLITMMYRPLLLIFKFPVVAWSGFQYGSSLVWYNVLNGTEALIMNGPPYNFSTAVGGLMYFAPLIGVIIGGFGTGIIGDRYAVWAARKNGGVREPEQRLILLSASAIFVPASLIMWGVGAAEGVSWVCLAFGLALIGASNGITCSLTLTYAFDAYRELHGEVVIAVIIIRNCLSFAIGYGITPWLELGYKDCFISAAFVGMGCTLTFIPVMIWGKSWRRSTKEAYWKSVEKSALHF